MKLLDRYLLKQFVYNLSLLAASLVAIYLLVDFFDRIDNFIESQKTYLAAKYFVFKIPVIIDQMFPVCLLLAAVITIGLLNRNHEFIALRAAGIHTSRLLRPVIIGTLMFSLLNLAASQWVLPASLAYTNTIWYEKVTNRVPKGIERKGRTYYRGENGIYTFIRPDPNKEKYTDFSYVTWDTEYDLSLFYTAKTAEYSRDGKWRLFQGQVKTNAGGKEYEVELFAEKELTLPETPDKFFVPFYKVKELSVSQLFDKALRAGKLEQRLAWFDFHNRLSFIFLGIPLVLLGLPILLYIIQRWQRDLAVAVPISCCMAFAAWGWWSIAQSLAKAEYIIPVLAAWNIHIIIGALGLYLIHRQNLS